MKWIRDQRKLAYLMHIVHWLMSVHHELRRKPLPIEMKVFAGARYCLFCVLVIEREKKQI